MNMEVELEASPLIHHQRHLSVENKTKIQATFVTCKVVRELLFHHCM